MTNTNKLISLLNKSYSVFHAVKNIEDELLNEGFTLIDEKKEYILEPGKNYYVKRNDSSIIAFKIPAKLSKETASFMISATHNDSPTFKIKPNPIIKSSNLLLLETEPYGGGIYNTWLDKPLTLAGRIFVKGKNGVERKLFYVDEDLLEIPNVCIHMNRNINSGYAYNPAVDMKPILGIDEEGFDFKKYILGKAGYSSDDELLGHDLFLANREKATLIGKNKELLASGRLDDLSAAYASLLGFIRSEEAESISVYASFDNEEVGSLTRQGANSTFLKETLSRIINALFGDSSMYSSIISRSMLLSIDNAHANHPNHPEYSSPTTKVNLNGGIVIKYNANQSYTSDGYSSSVLKAMMIDKKLSYQEYTNRSDLRGGSTLGNISNSEVSLVSVDIGLAQLSMHSSYEIMGKDDIDDLVELTKTYFSIGSKYLY